MSAKTVGAGSLGEMKNFVARRPVYTVLGTEKYERLVGVDRATGILPWRTMSGIITSAKAGTSGCELFSGPGNWRHREGGVSISAPIPLAKISISASFSKPIL